MWSECTSKPKVGLPMKIMDQRCKVEVGRWNKNANKTIQGFVTNEILKPTRYQKLAIADERFLPVAFCFVSLS